MPPVRGIHIYSSKEWLYYFTYCLTLGIDFKLQCTCLKFCHRKNKKIIIFYIIYKFPWQLYSDSVSSHWYKTTFVLEFDERNNIQFPSDPRKCHISKTRLKCSLIFTGLPGLHRLQGESWALAMEYVWMTSWTSSRQNNHEEVVDKTVLTACRIKQNKYNKQ